MVRDFRIALLGFGVVGAALSRMLAAKQEELRRRCGFGTKTVTVTTVHGGDELAVEGPSAAVKFHCKYSGTRTVSGVSAEGVTTSIAILRDLISLRRSRDN